jgi:hypothetical protein
MWGTRVSEDKSRATEVSTYLYYRSSKTSIISASSILSTLHPSFGFFWAELQHEEIDHQPSQDCESAKARNSLFRCALGDVNKVIERRWHCFVLGIITVIAHATDGRLVPSCLSTLKNISPYKWIHDIGVSAPRTHEQSSAFPLYTPHL